MFLVWSNLQYYMSKKPWPILCTVSYYKNVSSLLGRSVSSNANLLEQFDTLCARMMIMESLWYDSTAFPLMANGYRAGPRNLLYLLIDLHYYCLSQYRIIIPVINISFGKNLHGKSLHNHRLYTIVLHPVYLRTNFDIYYAK